jgi:hypothetical protein
MISFSHGEYGIIIAASSNGFRFSSENIFSQFRSPAEVQAHAEETFHTNFEESTEQV